MASYNKVILIGNLTRDPQMSYLPSQTPVVEFGLAVSRKWRASDGQMREDTCFIDCRSMGKQAETINQYFNKGKPILVEGRLQFDQWEGKDGTKRSKHRVFVERFSFVGSPTGGQQGGQQGQGGGYQQGGYQQAPVRPAPSQAAPPQMEDAGDMAPPPYEEEPGPDSIPF